ncbi:MAG: hypothetical protein HC819_24995 [Cyclobacteriaceae bacterium]|nr:hypothetical protein [Cyclobacteriaceae bacterium]
MLAIFVVSNASAGPGGKRVDCPTNVTYRCVDDNEIYEANCSLTGSFIRGTSEKEGWITETAQHYLCGEYTAESCAGKPKRNCTTTKEYPATLVAE